jgi:hypothetical protein
VLVMLLIALALWLVQSGLTPPLAYLCAAAIGAVVSAILGVAGSSYFRNLKPDVTVQELKRDLAVAKEIGQ